jgi:hypothetical protein
MIRTTLAVAASGSVLLFASLASAQQEAAREYTYSFRDRRPAESPQSVAIELRVGRYVPNVDSEFSGAGPGPYQQMFGDSNRYSIGFEVDYQALRIPFLGTLGPGFGFGYTKVTANSFVTPSVTRRSDGEETALTILPMYLVAVLRADVFARETPVPLVPYAKLGLGFAPWTISNGGGTSSVDGSVGRGISYGPQFALGGMFLLDSIDATSAKEMDVNAGVNNSYVFVEWYVSSLNGFGSGNQLQVGTNTWVLGLALEM